MLLLELFPNVAKLLGISMVNIKFEKVRWMRCFFCSELILDLKNTRAALHRIMYE